MDGERNDPLQVLPAELILRVIDHLSISGVANLTATSKAWHQFIDDAHQDIIYSSLSKVDRPPTVRDFSFLSSFQSYVKYYQGVTRWKELCKRQTLLTRNWDSPAPWTAESVIQVGDQPIWRFRPDFKRRFILSTSQGGGFYVTDFDSGNLLWSLGEDDVRQYAHLEYEDGIAVFDRWGNGLEIWKADDSQRGRFTHLATLQHDVDTRGFMLRHRTLCVVSSQGQAFIYDINELTEPSLRLKFNIENDAVGHLDQDEEVVMYSMGTKGFHIYEKTHGKYLGALQPKLTKHFYHINHPDQADIDSSMAGQAPFPPRNLSQDRLIPLQLEKNPHPSRTSYLCIEHDDWGAGMLWENFAIGVSRGGRVFVCSDWRGALASEARAQKSSAIIECETDGHQFDLGGWLSVADGRALFEVGEQIYIFGLSKESDQPILGDDQPLIYSMTTCMSPELAVPVSWMGVFGDCIMSTFTTLCRTNLLASSIRSETSQSSVPQLFPTKAIRIVSIVPPDPASLRASHPRDSDDSEEDLPALPFYPNGVTLGEDEDEFHAILEFLAEMGGVSSFDPTDEDQLEVPQDEGDQNGPIDTNFERRRQGLNAILDEIVTSEELIPLRNITIPMTQRMRERPRDFVRILDSFMPQIEEAFQNMRDETSGTDSSQLDNGVDEDGTNDHGEEEKEDEEVRRSTNAPPF